MSPLMLSLSLTRNGVAIGEFEFTYDLIAFAIALAVLITCLVIRYSFRRTIARAPRRSNISSFDTPVEPPKPRRLDVPSTAPRAQRVRSNAILAAVTTMLGIAAWGLHHYITTRAAMNDGFFGQFKFVYVAMFALIAFWVIRAYAEPVFAGGAVNYHHVGVLVPVYNEHPEQLEKALRSLFYSSVPPHVISVTDDGTTDHDYTEISEWFLNTAQQLGITAYWQRTRNKGKRHAQITALRAYKADANAPRVTIWATMDSDCQLDPYAIEEGLKPFADRRVQSVAAVVLASNNQRNLLARITDNLFVLSQLLDRSAMSGLDSVLVNSGALAFYRAGIIEDNADTYLSETFGSAAVDCSDDSLLTLFALRRGKTVQQPTSFVFSEMPTKLKKHFRQMARWNRGAFIRGFWRLSQLPLLSWGFARQALGWMQFLVTTYILLTLLAVNPLLLVIKPSAGRAVPWEMLFVPVVIGYALALRYFSFRRSDMSTGSQLLTYLLTPAVWVWSALVLRFVRFYCWATCRGPRKSQNYSNAWGTR